MKHTEECEARYKAHVEWCDRWPKACVGCLAHGYIEYPGVYRFSDGSGEPPSTDLCNECTGNSADGEADGVYVAIGHCPRCGNGNLRVDVDTIPCPDCGWNWGHGSDDYMPDVDCQCWTVDDINIATMIPENEYNGD